VWHGRPGREITRKMRVPRQTETTGRELETLNLKP